MISRPKLSDVLNQDVAKNYSTDHEKEDELRAGKTYILKLHHKYVIYRIKKINFHQLRTK